MTTELNPNVESDRLRFAEWVHRGAGADHFPDPDWSLRQKNAYCDQWRPLWVKFLASQPRCAEVASHENFLNFIAATLICRGTDLWERETLLAADVRPVAE